jgi:hypothetical protein
MPPLFLMLMRRAKIGKWTTALAELLVIKVKNQKSVVQFRKRQRQKPSKI